MATVVFGGSGFVGLNVVQHLLERGSDVTAFDTAPVPDAARARFSALGGALAEVVGDVRDPASVRAAFARPAEAAVYGAAVTADAARDAAEPERVLEVNLLGFAHVLRAAREAGVRRVVNLSSASAYGEAGFGEGTLDEVTTVPDPRALYPLSKFASERLGRRLGSLWRLDVRSVRLSGVFGPWERQTSVRDTPSPIYQVMRAAIEGRPALLQRPGRRDWTYAPDVARATVAVLEAGDLTHDLYNVACGIETTVLNWGRHLAARRPGFVCRLCEPGEAPTIDLFGDVDRQPLGVGRLKADTGFAPAFDLAASVADYDAWCGANPVYG